MPEIYLARHGQDEDNAVGILNGHRNQPLTKVGEGQAKELARGIVAAGLVFDDIYSSPLARAYATASFIADAFDHTPPIPLRDLIERDFGSMTGKPAASIESLCAPDIIKTDTITYFLSPPGAETFPELINRGLRLLAGLKERHTKGKLLLVTHGDIGKMIYAAYYRLDWRDFLPKFHFGNSDLLLLSPDSSPDEAHVIKIAQHNH